MTPISETDLILNPDGSIYHLNLLPEDIAQTIITVGDPDRVTDVSRHFDKIELKKGKREFITHTGTLNGKRLTVLSTGIGTDNIDIVLNELDALVNIDFKSRIPKPQLASLDIIRIGTSGALQADIAVDTILLSQSAIGLDSLMSYYDKQNTADEISLLSNFRTHFGKLEPYFADASDKLLRLIGKDLSQGITVTAPGFYAPQGRSLRIQNKLPGFLQDLAKFRFGEKRITNLEMETAGIYALSKVLGHNALSVNAILANRQTGTFSSNPKQTVDKAIELVLEKLAGNEN